LDLIDEMDLQARMECCSSRSHYVRRMIRRNKAERIKAERQHEEWVQAWGNKWCLIRLTPFRRIHISAAVSSSRRWAMTASPSERSSSRETNSRTELKSVVWVIG
jgi:hypothetical protein